MPKGYHNKHRKAGRHYRWNAGGSIASTGYVKLRVGKGHPLADPNGYAYEHLVVWCAAGNPRPGKGELIHHQNHDKTDNRLENLSLMTRAEHSAKHIAENGRCSEGRILGKKKAGRMLDGVTHDGFPGAA